MITGNHPALLSVSYVRPDKRRDIEECFEIVYQDDNGELKMTTEPAYATIYFTKDKYRDHDYNKPTERIDRLDPKRVLISKIRYEIAKDIGPDGEAFIEACFANRDVSSLDKLYSWRYSYRADFQPEFYFMDDFYKKHSLVDINLKKGFIDIELDLLQDMVDLDNLTGAAYAPINLITVFIEETKECYTLVRKPKRPSRFGCSEENYNEYMRLYEKQKAAHIKLFSDVNVFINDCKKSFSQMYGDINYHIREFDEEIDLLIDAFNFINSRKPHFMMAWNMRFDIQYIVERIKILGYDPSTVMCHKDFNTRRCSFVIDKRVFELEKQTDFFYCSAYTQYICQMRLYGSIRKSQSTLKSLKLNDIADRELGDNKVDYPNNASIREFPYIDWPLFIKYNIKDVLLQVGIDRKSNDLSTYYYKSHSNLTPYNKIFKEIHLLRNVRELYFNKGGWVQGNNINIINVKKKDSIFYDANTNDDETQEVTFKGAIMAEPTMNDNVGMNIMGKRSNSLFKNSMDYDMGAFYPSIKIASNMDPMTLLYKASFINAEFTTGEYVNNSLNIKYSEKDKNGKHRQLDITGEAINTFCSNNILSVGHNYMNLPTIDELSKFIEKMANSGDIRRVR